MENVQDLLVTGGFRGMNLNLQNPRRLTIFIFGGFIVSEEGLLKGFFIITKLVSTVISK
jgi:hypothetical protein